MFSNIQIKLQIMDFPNLPYRVVSPCSISQGFPLFLAKYHVGCYYTVANDYILKTSAFWITKCSS